MMESNDDDEFVEPRESLQLRKLKPYKNPADLDDDDVDGEEEEEDECPCSYISRERSPSPRRVSFDDVAELAPSRTQTRTMVRPQTPARRRTPPSASLSTCACSSGAATRKPSAVVARTPSSCSCGSKAPDEVESLFAGRSRSQSPCPALARHSCSLSSAPRSTNPCSFSMLSMEGTDSKAGSTCGTCAPPRRVAAEDLVERRQPSWWEPALSRVLSVVVSTVLLLATGGAQPSAEHLTWTKDFLRCVKDRAGNPPPNVAALLTYLETIEPPPAPAASERAEPGRQSQDNADRVSRTSHTSHTSRTSRVSL